MIQSITSSSPAYSFEKPTNFGSPATKPSRSSADGSGDPAPTQANALTAEEQQQVQQLKQIDRKVRAHEQAHLAAGADLVRGGATYSYQTGPDNQRYAVGGEVSIDASPAGTPQETIAKARQIRAAALAPADPSAQDQSVAANASRMESNARMELAAQRRQEAASTDQGNTRTYRMNGQGNDRTTQVGATLDIFA